MSSHLKKTSIALAVAAVSGMTFAAPTQLTETKTDTVLNNDYQQTVGTEDSDAQAGRYTSEKDIIMEGTKQVGALVSQTSPVVNGPETQVGGINYRNYTYQEIRKGLLESRDNKNTTSTVDGTTTNLMSWNDTLATGNITRTANTRVQLDKTVNPATEIEVTSERLDDTGFTFAADDVNTVIGAHTESNAGLSEDVAYAATDEHMRSAKFSITNSNLTTEAKLGADGKPISGQTIRVGTVESKFSQNDVKYQSTSDSATGKVTSKNAEGMLSSGEQSWSNHTVSTDYQHQNNDPTKDVVAFNLSADRKSVIESTVDTNKSAFSSKNLDYDDVNTAGLDYKKESKWSQDNTKESMLDGFIRVDKVGNEFTETQFNQAALGASDALDFIRTSKSSSEQKYRDFVTNENGEVVLTNAKPTIKTETEEKNTFESYDSAYQPTRYTADNSKRGILKGDAYNTQILNDGTPTIWTDTDVQKSTMKGTASKVVTHKQDGDFQEHWKTSLDNSTIYARNPQENIEVDRDLVWGGIHDNKFLSKIMGVTVTESAKADDFKIGTVAVDVNGNKFTAADVHNWKDAEGTDHYYVVIGQDVNGSDIRSEVTFKAGKPLETKAAEQQTVTTELGSYNRNDKVTMGQEIAYHTTDKFTWDNKETSKDGSTIYSADKGGNETDIKVYSVGKNALHREAVATTTSETIETEFDRLNGNIIFKGTQPVVNTVAYDKQASQQTDRLFQEGQDKVRENISTASYESKTTDAVGTVQKSRSGHDNITTVDYAKGKELAQTVLKDSADEINSNAITSNLGYNYTGTAKANIDSNTLRNDGTVAAGLAVKNARAGNIIIDQKLNISNVEDNKTYQDGGVKALESTTTKTNIQTITYADGTTGTVKGTDNQESTITLFNKGKADKYRESVTTTQTENSGKTFRQDADGDIILVKGKPVEQGTMSDKQTIKTTQNLYQIGQERKADEMIVTDSSKVATNVNGSTRNLIANTTEQNIEYRAGQKDGVVFDDSSATTSELKAKNTDNSGFTYKVESQNSTVINNTTGNVEDANRGELNAVQGKDYLLAKREVKSVDKHEWTESLAADGKDTVSITRGNETVKRTDSSTTSTIYGSEKTTTASGVGTTVSKKQVNVVDKFGIGESSSLSHTESKIASDKSITSTTATRTDTVKGVVLTATQTNTDTSGQSTTTEQKTTIDSGHVTTGQVVADRIILQGKEVQGEINRLDSRADQLNRRVDDVQKTAYRGIAIALAAQQAVPNIQSGQVAVFGGVGHYEGETAGSIGVVTSFTDRISASGALGFAGGNEFGGRVGVAYLFGGK
ncbi:YadA C-terminal domain-containing protein [Acinetobacter sp. Ac_5812]|uniref:YadA C-terminal domain-containing protein n=1 Tax=Acinetobacter sp. Ac_5812 TaxID=1848937 RepID=UPI001490864C|nr:YadA C-terminal domain-containing protein [Acinetobacter sp. Ac_5812]NNP69521.1 hypothetical protein [Acinetobacter sp. Ac_5812]